MIRRSSYLGHWRQVFKNPRIQELKTSRIQEEQIVSRFISYRIILEFLSETLSTTLPGCLCRLRRR